MKLQTVQDKGNVIDVIAAAFNDDDVLCYILNVETTETSTKKTKLIRRYQEILTNVYFNLDQPIWGESKSKDPSKCVALWMKPGVSYLTNMFSNGILSFLGFGFGAVIRIIEYALKIGNWEQKFVKEHGEYYHLGCVGTHPDYQGQGLLRDTLSPMLKRADKEGRYCFLESTKEKNVAIYERFGFEILNVVYLGLFRKEKVPVFIMTRKPCPNKK